MKTLERQATTHWPHRAAGHAPRHSPALHRLPAAVLVALLLLSVVVALVTRAVESDQDNRLLLQRANEVNLVLGSSIGSLETTLTGLGNVARDGTKALFMKEALG